MIAVLLSSVLMQPATAVRVASDDQAWRLFQAIRSDWETWASAADTFRKDGADPGPWGAAPPGVERFELPSSDRFPKLRHIAGGRMVPVRDPLNGAKRLVEVRLNSITYDAIRSRHLYTVDGQRRAVTAGRVEFPPGAMQLKAAWRPIEAAERRRYHTLTLNPAGGRARLYGLVALNFTAKTGTRWLWASFEHADLPDDAHGRGVWAYYRLRGTQTTYLDAGGQPVRLGNSELEAGLADSASCMTCHARAAVGVAVGSGRLPVFAPAPAGIRRGYVGTPDPAWFGHADAGGRWQVTYAPLDFVWSLTQAAEHGPRQRARAHSENRP